VNRRLYRCDHDRKLAGVAGGIAEYFDVDVSLVRILWIVSILFGGFGILLYVVMALVVPLEPVGMPPAPWTSGPVGSPDADPGTSDAGGQPVAGAAPAGWQYGPMTHRHAGRPGSGLGMAVFGGALVLFGALALVDQLLPAWADQGRFLWPAFILGVGALLVAVSMRRQKEQA
jgi:phage shock protein C